MKLAVFAFTRRGCDLARKTCEVLQPEKARAVTMEKFAVPGFETYSPPLSACMASYFHWADCIVFIGSTGMAVRAIAPWVRDKKTDPAVICMDESGNFVISLLSGHIGGANDLTRQLAAALGAQPVITTATDVRGRFSPDDWAARNGFAISSMDICKAVSAAILEQDIPVLIEGSHSDCLPAGTYAGDEGELGIYIGIYYKKPFDRTLRLVPKCLRLGIGCRRDTPEEKIESAVSAALRSCGIAKEAVKGVYSIDLKANEPGLLAFAQKRNLKTKFYTPEELLTAPGQYPASAFVQSVTGVDNVCQRAAMLDAETLILPKTAMDGVTVSIASEKWEAVF